MDTKLTLKLNQDVIERAKSYASNKKLSLSRLIENYLNSLTSENFPKDEIQISPFVKSLSSGLKLDEHHDYILEYKSHLEEKYK
ncbi:DUF6364 family protein [Flavobacterium silvaticum]|uniref:Antitoxin n=1 Tax=Flavobacterium silvaticum TaxID=1852020 RepID=A0A972FNJ3_9FLAO|nr:DUF6364 family protein [Flavobacterium silvaticum]NMH26509.1 hypothetical protein [Flavobacterium silvaticum]